MTSPEHFSTAFTLDDQLQKTFEWRKTKKWAFRSRNKKQIQKKKKPS